jgi:Zn-dependent protease
MLKIKNAKDFYSGLLFFLFGLGFAWGATRYDMGTAARMGAGYFPFLLGGLLTVIGIGLLVRSFVTRSEDGHVARLFIKPGLLLFGSLAAFALLLRPAGLVISIFAIILISSLASRDLRFREALISAIILCVASIAVFVYALNLQIPVWPAFMDR